jgi:hypothetical protein
VAALHGTVCQPRPRLHEEFVDGDVGRQPILAQRGSVERLGIGPKQPVEQGLSEAALQRRAEARARQRKAREDRELQAAISGEWDGAISRLPLIE